MLGLFSKTKQSLRGDGTIISNRTAQNKDKVYSAEYRLGDYVGMNQVETTDINRCSSEVKEGFKHQSIDPETNFQLQQQWKTIFCEDLIWLVDGRDYDKVSPHQAL